MPDDINQRERSNVPVNRRSSLKMIGGAFAVAAGGSLSVGSVSAGTAKPDISVREAFRVAQTIAADAKEKDAYSDFSAGGVQKPELYYSITGEATEDNIVPSVYVFPVTNDDGHVGHITVGAQSEMPPVVEYGTTPAPHANMEQVKAETASTLSFGDQFLYQGPFSFGISVVDKSARDGSEYFVDLERGFSYDRDAVPHINPDAGTDYSERWDQINESTLSDGVGMFDVEPLDSGYIYGVPNWTDTGYSDWPGCSPIAAAMALGYHETFPSRTDLIDGLNDAMGTDSDGLTWPWDIPSGIEDYDGSYSASNNYIGRPSAAKGGVDNYNPPLVSTLGDKEAGKEDINAEDVTPNSWDAPVGHTETIVGYEEESTIIGTDLYLDTHNTWGSTRTVLVGDYWDTYMITTIEP